MRVVLRTLAMTALMAGVAAPVAAQMPRAELSGIVGWNWSDGVEGDGVLAGDGNIYNEIGPADSFAWGLDLGFNVSENVQVGFLFGQQMSTVEISGTAEREIGDFNVNTYHGYVAFNLTPPDAPVRPYFMLGLGATQYRQRRLHRSRRGQRHDRRRYPVLGYARRRREGVCRQHRRAPRRAVDADLHQERFGGLVVRSVLGLLRRR